MDADGISSAAIMIKLLKKLQFKFSLSIVQQLTNDVLKQLSREHYSQYIFTDLGSGQINNIKGNLANRKALILDHHLLTKDVKQYENIMHVNPFIHGIDGGTAVSGSGVVYLFSKQVFEIKDMAHIALLGAIGDMQENDGFSELNNVILEDATKAGKIRIERGLRFFGYQTKPLYQMLKYSTDLYIPGVTGDDKGAAEFMQSLGIQLKRGDDFTKLSDLNEEEMKNLAAAIILKRKKEENPDDIFGNIYVLTDEKHGSPTRDAREFSTLLNACGRLGRASLGMGACLGNENNKIAAISSLQDYKNEIIKAVNWYWTNINTPYVIKGDKYIIINAQDNILATINGTLASILSKSGNFEDGTLIMAMAQLIDNTTKVSLRVSGKVNESVDLRKILKSIIKETGGEAGGHRLAAGAIVPTEKERMFVEKAKVILKKAVMEEMVV